MWKAAGGLWFDVFWLSALCNLKNPSSSTLPNWLFEYESLNFKRENLSPGSERERKSGKVRQWGNGTKAPPGLFSVKTVNAKYVITETFPRLNEMFGAAAPFENQSKHAPFPDLNLCFMSKKLNVGNTLSVSFVYESWLGSPSWQVCQLNNGYEIYLHHSKLTRWWVSLSL